MGRPRLPEGAAKGRIVPVRFSEAELGRIATAASLSNQKLSDQKLSE
jgi:hypothetical protein